MKYFNRQFKALSLATVAMMMVASGYPQQPSADGPNASSAPPGVKEPPRTQFHERFPRYRIAPGDVCEIVFEFTPEFNQTLTVQPDGYIALRSVGDVHVADRTVPETKEVIRDAYSQILNRPQIAVLLKDFQKPFFIVGGQVSRPGKYELREEMTLTQAIAVAGGFTA